MGRTGVLRAVGGVGERTARFRVPQALYRGPDLRLAADDDEDEHPLQCVDQIRHQPDVVRSLEHPGRDVGDPGDAHDDHQLHADSSQGSAFRGGLDIVPFPKTTGQLSSRGGKQKQIDEQQNAHRSVEVGQYLQIVITEPALMFAKSRPQIGSVAVRQIVQNHSHTGNDQRYTPGVHLVDPQSANLLALLQRRRA